MVRTFLYVISIINRRCTSQIYQQFSPKALILHFKRYSIVTPQDRALNTTVNGNKDVRTNELAMGNIFIKNKTRINLEDPISIPISSCKRTYHLRGVVHHIGNSTHSGHYTCCAVRTNTSDAQDNSEQWVYFNDEVAIERDFEYVSLDENNQRNCYMAVYELR